MILYLCRHAAAEDPTSKLRDADWPLTAEGIKKFRRAARGFCALHPEVTHIVTSPLLRARQTAEILFDALADAGQISADSIIVDGLGPPGKLDPFLARLHDIAGARNIVAVGHEPTLSTWIGQLCFGTPGRCVLKKGAMAALDLTAPNRGELLWLMQPAQLRRLEPE